MTPYTGECIGGPHDGQMLAHTSKVKRYYSPVGDLLPVSPTSGPIDTVVIGEYIFSGDARQWYWYETTEGRALKALYQ